MFKMVRNKKGQTGLEIPISVYVIGGIMAIMTSVGLVKTAKNGVLVNNMKVIGCKVMNKGEQFCNKKYNYTPKVKVEKAKGGKLRANLLAKQKE